VGWRGGLDEDAVDGGVGVEIGDDGEEIVLRGGCGEGDVAREEAEIAAGADLGADVGLGGGVIADDDDGEAGDDALSFHGGDVCAAFFKDFP
jgi:hypothetical protein